MLHTKSIAMTASTSDMSGRTTASVSGVIAALVGGWGSLLLCTVVFGAVIVQAPPSAASTVSKTLDAPQTLASGSSKRVTAPTSPMRDRLAPHASTCSDGHDNRGHGLLAHPADHVCSSHADKEDEPNPSADPAPNCIGEPADHPVVNYPEQRVFLEAQGWWDDRDDDGQVARFGDSEHLHIGTCFPLQKTVKGTVRLDMRVVGHNLPAGAKLDHTRLHDAGQKHYGDIRYDHVVAKGEHDVTIWRKNVQWNSKQAKDGLREIRFLTFVKRPDGAEIHASTGWCVNVQNGKKDSNDGSCGRRLTEGRGWYDCLEYKISRFDGWTYPYAGIPAGKPYSLPVTGQDGAPFGGGGDDAVTRHWLRVDPAFHSGTLGTLVSEHLGAHRNEKLTIPGSVLTPGIHRLFLMTERDGSCTNLSSGTVFPNQLVPQNGIISGGISVPIKVTAPKQR
jgi:hypothetical protein